MKLPYENELYELRKWIDFTNANLQMQFLHTVPSRFMRKFICRLRLNEVSRQ